MGGLSIDIPKMGQGPAVPIDPGSIEETRDEAGFTHPNLHRRIDTDEPEKYELGIYGLDSYRLTDTSLHDEESTTSEIP